MAVLYYLQARLAQRLAELRRPEESDRGDGPVPTAIIIAGLAVLGVAVLIWATGLVQQYMETDVPNMPGVPGVGDGA
ncbi:MULTISPECIES: hypothetical protein [Polymorphospora]|uniref:Uncharacterized protein n=1 Tax=Polymorphospora lycopeni TaxID=3140240 RepID=A0ABV5CID2_9ACTN